MGDGFLWVKWPTNIVTRERRENRREGRDEECLWYCQYIPLVPGPSSKLGRQPKIAKSGWVLGLQYFECVIYEDNLCSLNVGLDERFWVPKFAAYRCHWDTALHLAIVQIWQNNHHVSICIRQQCCWICCKQNTNLMLSATSDSCIVDNS